MASWNFYVFVLVMVAIASGVAALKCYECSGCNDPFDSSGVTEKDCLGSCVKLKANDVVQRYCSPISGGDTCESKDKKEGCSCTSNLCNSAPSHGIAIISLMSITVAALLWKN